MSISFAVRSDITEKIKKEYQDSLDKMTVNELVKEFFSYLDHIEETDSGREFHPIELSSCRVLMTQPLNMCLEKLRERVK